MGFLKACMSNQTAILPLWPTMGSTKPSTQVYQTKVMNKCSMLERTIEQHPANDDVK